RHDEAGRGRPERGARALRQGRQDPIIHLGHLRYELGVPGSTSERPHLAAVDSGEAGKVGMAVNALALLVVSRLHSGLYYLIGLARFLVAAPMPPQLDLAALVYGGPWSWTTTSP